MGFPRVLLAVLLLLVPSVSARAGGGPENVVLIVNSASEDSKTVANHFMQLRQIPPRNVVYLPWTKDANQIDFATFRSDILLPVFEQIRLRGIDGQIDYLIYSCGFPTRVAAPEVKKKLPAQLSPFASITGATYLCRLWDVPVAEYHKQLFLLYNNFYCQPAKAGQEAVTTQAFHAGDHWLPGAKLDEKIGARYLLSMMLGTTASEGNTAAEIVKYLNRSAAADGTLPDGTIYFMKNGDVRSTTRQSLFPLAIRELEKLGVKAVELQGTLPQEKEDVAGLMAGSAALDWTKSKSKILPGAFCEHLTSFGGVVDQKTGQTTLREFLRHGAAAATGTVKEPYAIQAKFPLPTLHVHYARGATAAEALYQSVAGPYQLLAVGDPLCRPWARIPQVDVAGVDPGATVSGTIELRPQATTKDDVTIDRFELFLDGLRVGNCAADGKFSIDTMVLADGDHELRVVAIEATDIATQGRAVLRMNVDNQGRNATLSITEQASEPGEILIITAHCEGADRIEIQASGRPIGDFRNAQGEITVASEQLGSGPVQFQAKAFDHNGRSIAASAVVIYDVKP